MRIMVLNSGSSSIKYQLFDMSDETALASGIVEQIGEGDSRLRHRGGREDQEIVAGGLGARPPGGVSADRRGARRERLARTTRTGSSGSGIASFTAASCSRSRP